MSNLKIILLALLILNPVFSLNQDQTLPDFFQIYDEIWENETLLNIQKERNKYVVAAYNLGDPATTANYIDKRQGLVYLGNPKVKMCWNGENILDPTESLFNTQALYKTGIVTTNNGGNPIDFGTYTDPVTGLDSTTNSKTLYENICQADATVAQSMFIPFWINNNVHSKYMTTWFRFKLVNIEASVSNVTFELEHYDTNKYIKDATYRKAVTPTIIIPAYSAYEVEISVERLLKGGSETASQIYPDFRFTTYGRKVVSYNV
jgi:hypothetical protein